MIKKNKEIYNSQLDFVENAAYELQSPLAEFQTHINALDTRDDITSEQRKIIGNIKAISVRLDKLSKNLLLLSNIETDDFLVKESVSLNEILNRQIDIYTPLAKQRNIVISADIPESITIKSNPVLIETLVANLFENAIFHNISNGTIYVALFKETITFYNTGVAKPLTKGKLFKRFSKVNPSSQGNGLGLVIIRKIVELNGWGVNYNHQNKQHIFQVTF